MACKPRAAATRAAAPCTRAVAAFRPSRMQVRVAAEAPATPAAPAAPSSGVEKSIPSLKAIKDIEAIKNILPHRYICLIINDGTLHARSCARCFGTAYSGRRNWCSPITLFLELRRRALRAARSCSAVQAALSALCREQLGARRERLGCSVGVTRHPPPGRRCRYPFLLVDRVVELEIEKYAVGYKNVTMNDNFFTGHFPERAIMPGTLPSSCQAATPRSFSRARPHASCWFPSRGIPPFALPRSPRTRVHINAQVKRVRPTQSGVLQIEAMAQLGGIVMLNPDDTASKNQFFFGGIEGCRFRKPVVPGDTLVSGGREGQQRDKGCSGILLRSGRAARPSFPAGTATLTRASCARLCDRLR